jgi:hypothetical protein
MSKKSEVQTERKRLPFLPYFLGFIFLLFIGILIYTWIETDRGHPIILDEQGVPR